MTVEDIIKPENLVYQKSKLLTEKPFHYCPGCGHGTIHRIIAEVNWLRGQAILSRINPSPSFPKV